MNLTIDRQFGKRIIDLTWPEVSFAVSKGWMEPGVAVDLAVKALESDSYSQQEVELAALDYSDKYGIVAILEALSPNTYAVDNDKWAKVFVTWLYEHRSELENPIQSLEMLWADFEYPESIAHFANQYSPNESHDRNLVSEWKRFLDSEVYSVLVQSV